MGGPDQTAADRGGSFAHRVSGTRKLIGLIVGLAAFAAMLLLPPPAAMPEQAWRTAAIGILMAIFWVSEAIPIPATALIPLVCFPLLGVQAVKAAAGPYANPLIFLFMGGFIIALAMERWNLHQRIALTLLAIVGTRQDRLIAGFMIAAAGLSMWVSNTATTVMMLPIALSVIRLFEIDPDRHAAFPVALLLSVAYAASIGGMGTLIGTPPNALLAGFMLETYGVNVGFGRWMIVGLPLVLVMLALTWLLMTRVAHKVPRTEIEGARGLIAGRLAVLGPMSRPEKIVAAVFVLTALAWIFRPLLARALPGVMLDDSVIAIAAALALFLIPLEPGKGVFVMNWEWAKRLPWGVLLLFGGGLSLASAVAETGLAEWIGQSLAGLAAWPTVALVLAVVTVIIFLTELTSNTATTAAFLPVLAALAVSIGQNPFLLVVPAALAASCAFMMPVATPPNAIVYGSGHVTIAEMVNAGFRLNLVGMVVITGLAYTVLLWAFGVQVDAVPDWATAGRAQ